MPPLTLNYHGGPYDGDSRIVDTYDAGINSRDPRPLCHVRYSPNRQCFHLYTAEHPLDGDKLPAVVDLEHETVVTVAALVDRLCERLREG